MSSSTEALTPSQSTNFTYADDAPRISKENLFMVLALWMEQFPLEDDDNQEADSYRKVGAVLVLPNNMLHAVDCSRDGVHGIARLLTKNYDVTKDCEIFVSRKPCSFCTKLLVQCKIKRVFYLPIEPEYKDVEDFKEETSRVDELFKASSIGQSVFVPTVAGDVIPKREQIRNTPPRIIDRRKNIKVELMDLYCKDEWMKTAKDNLPWPAFDGKIKEKVEEDFGKIMEWMAGIKAIEEEKGDTFQRKESTESSEIPFDASDKSERASFLINMARFLAERSDDPKTGVGAVITNRKLEIVALGWNGYPTKARYGEFARASHDDTGDQGKKYPFTIHAEQNALLLRNTKNLTNGILFVTKTPCDECTPLLAMERIKTVVLGEKMNVKEQSPGTLGYQKFAVEVRKGTFICFEVHKVPKASGNNMGTIVPRNLNPDLDKQTEST